MTLDDLLKAPSGQPKDDVIPQTIGERLAELVYKNGGRLDISSWGVTEIGGLYGEIGLQQNEAFELLYLSGMIRGFGLATDIVATEKRVMLSITEEWKRIEATLKREVDRDQAD
jgi:hypothetical protein